jgi:hypothetical protein
MTNKILTRLKKCFLKLVKNLTLTYQKNLCQQLLDRIQNRLKKGLNTHNSKFIRRQANSVAHALVRAANSWVNFHRFEIIPLYIEHLIANEMQ